MNYLSPSNLTTPKFFLVYLAIAWAVMSARIVLAARYGWDIR
jgi:hypothetical protein